MTKSANTCVVSVTVYQTCEMKNYTIHKSDLPEFWKEKMSRCNVWNTLE